MLNSSVRRKLNSMRDIPTIPIVISQVLQALDNVDIRATHLANLIERDQTLATRVLQVANSPFYGFSGKISTIDLAVVIMGLNSIKEIVIGLVVQRLFARSKKSIININDFWQYSLFCGSTARLLARKLGYKLAGEAFVTGLMHDLGILILANNFSYHFKKINAICEQEDITLIEAEELVLGCNHGDIGAWLADKWNFPIHLVAAIQNHHIPLAELNANANASLGFNEISQPLTAIVSISEYFAGELGYKAWLVEHKKSPLYLSTEIFDDISDDDTLSSSSAIAKLKQEIMDEFERASEFQQLPTYSVYK